MFNCVPLLRASIDDAGDEVAAQETAAFLGSWQGCRERVFSSAHGTAFLF